jgi:hypothetical protein
VTQTATVSISHPVLFVFDFGNRTFSVPVYDDAATVSANDTGISIKAVSEVDGEVTVHLTDVIPGAVEGQRHEVFVGLIPAPGKKIAVVTSENDKLAELDVASVRPRVRVLVDDPMFPADIWVEAR